MPGTASCARRWNTAPRSDAASGARASAYRSNSSPPIPTGPLHVGHGRGAAYGAAVANLLEAVGFAVHREYYVNDAGRQMDILAASVYLRYLELCGEDDPVPGQRLPGRLRLGHRAPRCTASSGDVLRHPLADGLRGRA